ncbi:MAG: RrF2 family transcriptional regulator [bacterium]
MLELSARTVYGVAAVFELACRGDSEPCRVAVISENQGIPRNYLDQILLELKKGGFVRSHRGVNGGYSLDEPAEDITVWDVIRVLEGGVQLSAAVEKESEVLEEYWNQAQRELEDKFQTSFQELVDRWKKRQGTLNYSI